MWNMVGDMMPDMSRFGFRRKRGMNTATAMLLGAGIGIAAWAVLRRNNSAGMIMNGMNAMNGMHEANSHDHHQESSQSQGGEQHRQQSEQGVAGMDNDTVTKMAKDIMNAIQ